MNQCKTDKLDLIISGLDKNDSNIVTLSMAKSIVEEGINDSDPDAAYKISVIEDATAIIGAMESSRRSCICVDTMHGALQSPGSQKIIHEHYFPRQENLTSWLMWVIIPFAVTFLLVAGALMLH